MRMYDLDGKLIGGNFSDNGLGAFALQTLKPTNFLDPGTSAADYFGGANSIIQPTSFLDKTFKGISDGLNGDGLFSQGSMFGTKSGYDGDGKYLAGKEGFVAPMATLGLGVMDALTKRDQFNLNKKVVEAQLKNNQENLVMAKDQLYTKDAKGAYTGTTKRDASNAAYAQA